MKSARHILQSGLGAVALAATLWMSPAVALPTGPTAQLAQGGLSEKERAWSAAMERRAELVEEFSARSERYREVADRIERAKLAGGIQGALGRGGLEALLRQARAEADVLAEAQRAIAAVDTQIEALRRAIARGVEARQGALEARLIGAATHAERAEIVAELNDLSASAARFARPLRPIDTVVLDAILEDADGLTDPGDMLALADELADSEESLRTQLADIDAELVRLRERRHLLRRSQSFAGQEAFFEEGARARVIQTRAPRAESNDNEPQPAPQDDLDNAPRSPDTLEAAPDPIVAERGEPDTLNNVPPTKDPVSSPVEGGGFGAGGGRGETPTGLGTPSGGGGLVPAAGAPGPNEGGAPDPFVAPADAIVLERQADPDLALGRDYASVGGYEDRLDALAAERARIKRQADAMRARARKLRTQAHQAQ